MPIYVYRNLNTGETFEVEQRMVEPALTADPITGDPVKRLIQPVGIAFKGSGFYVTDSRGKNGAGRGKSNGAAGDGAAGAAKTDAKGDAATGASTASGTPSTSGASSATAAAD
jgi:predicted nucleic acid-binding Zn ribbon protein